MTFRLRSSLRLFLTCLTVLCLLPASPSRLPAQDKPAAEQPENPLKQLIQGILGQNNGQAAPEQQLEEIPEDEVEIDHRFPLIREQEKLLADARIRMDEGRWNEAIEILQNLLEEGRESVVLSRDGSFRALRWETQALISRLPPEAKQQYQKTYGPLAIKLLNEADASGNLDQTRQVAERYFHTEAGYSAANRIASYHLDQGQFAVAALWYRRLAETDADFVNDSLWRFKVGEVYRQAEISPDDLEPWVTLTPVMEEELARRLPDSNAASVRSQWAVLDDVYNPPIQDWLLPGGTSQRTGHASGSDPLLAALWKHPLTFSSKINQQIAQLYDDLDINALPGIPAFQSIAVGDRVIFRTFDGLKVVETETGKTVWESRDAIPPSQLLTGQTSLPTMVSPFQDVNANTVSSYMTSNQLQHPLVNFLFRNGVHGTISSDGKRVFVIERNAVLTKQTAFSYYSSRDPASTDPYDRDWNSNRLTAYDIETGQQLWNAGGRKMNETIDPPLAGTFFFGSPLADHGELFAIGEQDNALVLYCLDAETGQQKWNQLLAYTETTIDLDTARRWWPCSIALSEGILVCPTNLGLMVGVDRNSHEIVWISRYSDPNNETALHGRHRGGGYFLTPTGSLNDRWSPSPPMIQGQTIVYAPAEKPVLMGIRLTDGKELWTTDNLEEGLYPAGCYENQALIVHQQGVRGFELATGEQAWNVSFAELDNEFVTQGRLPTGRGLIVENDLLIPMSGGEIWYFDLQKKAFRGRTRVDDASLRMGNLIMAHGQLLSTTAREVSLFQPRQIVLEQIELQQRLHPQDPWAYLKQSKIQTLDQDYEASLKSLRKIHPEKLLSEQRVEYQAQLRDTLFGLITAHPEEYAKEFAELKNYLTTDAERLQYYRLQAKRQIAQGDHVGAFRTYDQLAQLPNDTLLSDRIDRNLTMRLDTWLNSRLTELWAESVGEVSSQMTQSVRVAVEEAVESQDLTQMQQVLQLYHFHPETEPLFLEIVEQSLTEHSFAAAEFALARMLENNDPSVVATGWAKRAELLLGFSGQENDSSSDQSPASPRPFQADAAWMAEQLRSFPADLVLLDGWTVGEWLTKHESAFSKVSPTPRDSGWSSHSYTVSYFGTSNWNNKNGSINQQHSPLPFYQNHRFNFDQPRKRLQVFDNLGDEMICSIPVQEQPNQSASPIIPIGIQGHLVTFYYRGVLQCYSLPDQRLVWTRSLDEQGGQNSLQNPARESITALHKVSGANNKFRLNQPERAFGPVVHLSPDTICYVARHELFAINPLDGEIKWRRRGVPTGTSVYGDKEYLCLVPPDLENAMIVLAADGTRVRSPQLQKRLRSGIAVKDQNLLSIEEHRTVLGLEADKTLVSRNLLTGDSLWNHPIADEDRLGILNDRYIVIVGPSGYVRLLDFNNGSEVLNCEVGSDELDSVRDLFALADKDRLYLVANRSSGGASYLNRIHNQRVNGTIFAINRQTGDFEWEQGIDSQHLILENIEQMPVFLLGRSKPERKHGLYLGSFSVCMIDKQTGKVLLDETLMTQNQQVHRITWSSKNHQIHLHANNSIYIVEPESESNEEKAAPADE